MKNIEKKWLLFVIATVVSCYGIGYNLIKGTRATDNMMPVNDAFDDVNFYRCVVDSYNMEYSTEYDYTTYNLSDDELSMITYLDCNGVDDEYNVRDDRVKSVKGIEKMRFLTHIRLAYQLLTNIDLKNNLDLQFLDLSSNNELLEEDFLGNQISNIDLSNNTKLEHLYIGGNLLTEIDLSKNTKLLSLDLSKNKLTTLDLSNNTMLDFLVLYDNLFEKDIYIYKNSETSFENNIIFPDNSIFNNLEWVSNDNSVVTINGEGKLVGVGSGVTYISAKDSENMSILYNNVSVEELTSSKYNIDSTDYIYVGTDSVDVIKKHIDLFLDETSLFVSDDMKILHVKKDEQILKDFNLLTVSFGNYEIIDKCIKLDNEVSYADFVRNITKSGGLSYKIFDGDTEITDGNIKYGMEVYIYYNGDSIDSYVLVQDSIDFSEDLVVNDLIISNITVNTTVKELRDKITASVELEFYDKDNNLIENDDSKLKTGDKVKVMLSSELLIYTLSVNGDINGDGQVNVKDVTFLRRLDLPQAMLSKNF